MSKLAIVIINFDRQNDTLACLRSLRDSTVRDMLVIVLNWKATAAMANQQRAAFPDVEIAMLGENRGYAGNNNLGVQRAMDLGAEWVLLLNEDTVLDPACLAEMLAVANSSSKIGVVGPTVYHYDEPNVIQSAGGAFDRRWRPTHDGQNALDAGQYAEARDIAWASGCALLLRCAMLRKIGFLDERFYCYYEETDLCARARAAGWRIVHAPQARLWHRGVSRDYKPAPYVAYYMTRNRLLFLAKHHAPFLARGVAWFETLRTLISYSVKEKWREVKREERGMIARGLRDYIAERWGALQP